MLYIQPPTTCAKYIHISYIFVITCRPPSGMAAASASGSPAPGGRSQFDIHEDDGGMGNPSAMRQAVCSSSPTKPMSLSLPQSSKHAIKHSDDPVPLASSKLGNAQIQAGDPSAAGYKVTHILPSPSWKRYANGRRSRSSTSLPLQSKPTRRVILWTPY